MSEEEILLVMTICRLLGKTPNTKNVLDAYRKSEHELQKNPPSES